MSLSIAPPGAVSPLRIPSPPYPVISVGSISRCAFGSTTTPISPNWSRPQGTLLPHAAAILIHHRRSHFAMECLLELRHVGDHTVGPILLGRMRIHRCA